jgi:hypothetical protein
MAQFQSPINYVTGDQVTAANLNNHINGAVALPGLIADQSSMSANNVASTDQILINDGGVLKKTTVGDVLNSNLAATFTSITATNFVSDNVAPGANKDLGLSPNAGVAVTGKTFTSVNGINVTVNSTAHNVLQNQVLTITASIAAYSGEYRVVSVTTDTFEYVLPEAATPNSGSCDYTKTASVVTTGNSVITSDEYLIGNQDVGGNSKISGNSTINGNLTVKGTADFTGAFQVNGTVGYVFTEVFENNIINAQGSVSGALHTLYTTPSLTKLVGEVWVLEFDFNLVTTANANSHWRITDSADSTVYASTHHNTVIAFQCTRFTERFVLDSSSTLTGSVFVLRARMDNGWGIISPTSTQLSANYPDKTKVIDGKFRIYKYKTA